MIARQITYFGQPAVVACDARCDKAWGSVTRPSEPVSDADDDVVFLADDELGEAPADPGTYEGGHAKPVSRDDRLNKWCVRACERCAMSRPGKAGEVIETRDWSRRIYNLLSSDPAHSGRVK